MARPPTHPISGDTYRLVKKAMIARPEPLTEIERTRLGFDRSALAVDADGRVIATMFMEQLTFVRGGGPRELADYLAMRDLTEAFASIAEPF